MRAQVKPSTRGDKGDRQIEFTAELDDRRAFSTMRLVPAPEEARPLQAIPSSPPRPAVRSSRATWSARSTESAAAIKLRPIKVHHLRHTTATLLKNPGVPARDAQIILGHSRLAVTLEIYTHEDRQAQREALGRISEALGHASELPAADEKDGD